MDGTVAWIDDRQCFYRTTAYQASAGLLRPHTGGPPPGNTSRLYTAETIGISTE